MKDGIYISADVKYFVKDGKILARIMGSYYKVTENFMSGTWQENLSDGMNNSFDNAYESAPNW